MAYIIGIIVLVIGVTAFTFFQSERDGATVEQVTETRTPKEEVLPSETAPAASSVAETEVTLPTEEPDISLVSGLVDLPATADQQHNATVSTFADGSYTTAVSYFTPRRTEHTMDVTLVVADGVITDASILWDGKAEASTPSHRGFADAYQAEVIGQNLETIDLSRVGGASLTSDAFNEAIDTIEAEARA